MSPQYVVRCAQCRLHEISTHERCQQIAAVHTQVTKHREITIARYDLLLGHALAT